MLTFVRALLEIGTRLIFFNMEAVYFAETVLLDGSLNVFGYHSFRAIVILELQYAIYAL